MAAQTANRQVSPTPVPARLAKVEPAALVTLEAVPAESKLKKAEHEILRKKYKVLSAGILDGLRQKLPPPAQAQLAARKGDPVEFVERNDAFILEKTGPLPPDLLEATKHATCCAATAMHLPCLLKSVEGYSGTSEEEKGYREELEVQIQIVTIKTKLALADWQAVPAAVRDQLNDLHRRPFKIAGCVFSNAHEAAIGWAKDALNREERLRWDRENPESERRFYDGQPPAWRFGFKQFDELRQQIFKDARRAAGQRKPKKGVKNRNPPGPRANTLTLFTKGEPKDRNYVEFVQEVVTKRGNGKSDNANARGYTGETLKAWPKATKLIARYRRARKRGAISM